MATEIPIQFRRREFRFVLLDRESKRPFEKDWQNTNNYEFDNSKLLKHLENGGNYGILMGRGRLICFDLDNPNLVSYYDKKFKDTLIVETGSKKRHYLLYSDYNINKKINDVGELRCVNMQVVGANSIHPNKQPYKIINNNEIKEISEIELKKIFKNTFGDETTFVVGKVDETMSGVEYREVLKLLRESKTKEEIFEHMKNPIFEKWNTHGAKYPQYKERTFEKAKQFLINTNQLLQPTQQININNLKELPFWTIRDYENYKPSKSYIIEQIMYPEEIGMLYGQSGHFKSLDMLYRAVCIVSGKKYLGKFKVRKCAVAIISAENHKKVDKQRLRVIMNGLKIRNKDLPIYILPRENCGDILDKEFKLLVEDFIFKKGIKVLFVDTINPVTPQVDDNKAKDVTRIFNEFFKPLVDKHKITAVFLHHTDKKAKTFLGSTKFKANSDVASIIERKDYGTYTIYNEKNREGEIGSIEVGVEFVVDKKGETKEINFSLIKLGEQKGINRIKKKTKSEQMETKILTIVCDTPITRGELIKFCDTIGSVAAIDRVLKKLVRTKKLITDGDGYTKGV